MITYFDDPTEDYLENECAICGRPIEKEGYCSDSCFRASLR